LHYSLGLPIASLEWTKADLIREITARVKNSNVENDGRATRGIGKLFHPELVIGDGFDLFVGLRAREVNRASAQ
jgi:hypothetical protein